MSGSTQKDPNADTEAGWLKTKIELQSKLKSKNPNLRSEGWRKGSKCRKHDGKTVNNKWWENRQREEVDNETWGGNFKIKQEITKQSQTMTVCQKSTFDFSPFWGHTLSSVWLHAYTMMMMQFQTRLNVCFKHCLVDESSVIVALTTKARTLISFNI